MKNKSLLNLLLFFIAVTLATVIYLTDEKDTSLQKLSKIKSTDITSITILHNNNKTLITQQDKNKWQIKKPVEIETNTFRINSLLKLANAPIHNKYALTEIDATSIGLDNSKTSIQFNDQVIYFGITNPVTHLRFIKLNDYIYTIEDVYYPLISSHFGTLAALNLLPANSTIEKLILLNQTIARDDNGLWQSNFDISADTISKTLDHWLHDQAFGAHEYLQREKLGEVFIYIKGRQIPVSYQITDTDPWLIIARPEIGLEYHLDIEAYNNLITPIDTPAQIADEIDGHRKQ